jgi:CRP-like cAMP-binding protein
MMSVLDGKRRAGDAVALTDCEVLVIDRDIIAAFLARHPEANGALLQRYVASARRMETMLHDQAFLSVPMRLAKILVDYAVPEDDSLGSNLIIPAYLNQTELACLVGTSRESVNQSLKQFSYFGWIESDRKHIHIRDVLALRNFST